jgi:type II secretory pathway component PulM
MNFFEQLSSKDRQLLILLSIVVIAYLVYTLCYMPLQHQIEANELILKDKQETVTFIQQVNISSAPLKERKILNENQLLSLLNETFKKEPFRNFPNEINESSQKIITLSFKQVPFDSIITTLHDLSTQYVFTLSSIEIKKTKTDGIVHFVAVIAL